MAVITSGILAGATLSSVIAAGAGVAGAAAGIAGTAIAAAKKDHTPKYDAQKEKMKAANQEAEANRRRAMMETETQKTSALGNTAGTQVQKKTVLGG